MRNARQIGIIGVLTAASLCACNSTVPLETSPSPSTGSVLLKPPASSGPSLSLAGTVASSATGGGRVEAVTPSAVNKEADDDFLRIAATSLPVQRLSESREASDSAVPEAVLIAFEGYMTVVNAAQTEPRAKDWEPEVRRFAGGPAAAQLLQTIERLAAHAVRLTAPTTWDFIGMTASEVPSIIHVEYCLDLTERTVVDSQGRVIDGEAAAGRYRSTTEVWDYGPELGWLVSVVHEPEGRPTC